MWKSMPEVSRSIIMLFLWSNYEYIITAYRAKKELVKRQKSCLQKWA